MGREKGEGRRKKGGGARRGEVVTKHLPTPPHQDLLGALGALAGQSSSTPTLFSSINYASDKCWIDCIKLPSQSLESGQETQCSTQAGRMLAQTSRHCSQGE